jgi:hypothetical protein
VEAALGLDRCSVLEYRLFLVPGHPRAHSRKRVSLRLLEPARVLRRTPGKFLKSYLTKERFDHPTGFRATPSRSRRS